MLTLGGVTTVSITPLKTNMDTQTDGLENVSPFKYGHFWYLC